VTLRALAPAKVNLCLFLGEPRADGRHQLVTLFESVSLADELLVSVSDADQVVCPGVEGPNLVSRALEGLRARGWDAPAARVDVRKRIPVAAGMGGGSADAAAMLRVAVELAPVNPAEVAAVASWLGADVPSQLAPGLVLGTGAGEIVEPRQPLAPHALLVLPQPVALSTPDVYREADRLGLPVGPAELRSRYDELVSVLTPAATLPGRLVVNELEPAAVSLCPAIEGALAAAREAGADHAIVCGSGPTVAGLYWGANALETASESAGKLGARFPGAIAVQPVTSAFGSPVAL
jgi:4-diphosphocytidyl-2-C-methyl-D-erythritol kinase